MKIITSFQTLMFLARKEAEARKSGDTNAYEKAKQKHEEYRQICLKADEMILGRIK